ncbi:MAG: hypothetical protein BWY77_01322 [bacterium ADurb.Bin431]|nr:MAG: hypothetical protein BWY77_01322 [bacterium ADurb.Bin431]
MLDQFGRGDPVAEIELDAAHRSDHLRRIATSGGEAPVDEIADGDEGDGALFSQAERPHFGCQARLQLEGIVLVTRKRCGGRGGNNAGGVIAEAPMAMQLFEGGMAEAQRHGAGAVAQADAAADGGGIHLEVEAEEKGSAGIEPPPRRSPAPYRAAPGAESRNSKHRGPSGRRR